MAETRELGINRVWTTTFYQRSWSEHVSEAAGITERIMQIRNGRSDAVESRVAPGAKHGLYESDFDLLLDPNPGLQRLAHFIRETLAVAVSHVNGGNVPPEQLIVNLFESWCHVTLNGGFHDAHSHPSCSWCGIYYLSLGDRSARESQTAPNGGSRFYSPLPLGGRHQDYGNAYLGQHSLDPPLREGMLLLFPSYLLHSGLPYFGSSPRIVIAFNATIHRKPP